MKKQRIEKGGAITAATTALLGLIVGFLFCWFVFVRSLAASLDAREEALQEWERLHRIEREKIAAIETLSADEMRSWVAALDEQNATFAELQQLLHQQELDLVGPPYAQLALAVVSLLGVSGFVAWMYRDSNADAARTLDNAVAVLPSLRRAMQSRQAELLAPTSMPPALPPEEGLSS